MKKRKDNMNSKGFWYFLMIGAVALWGAAVATGFLLWPEGGLSSWYFLIGVAALHLSEVPIVLRMLADKNTGKGTVALKTFVFGFTWWLPYKKGILPR